MSRIYVTPTGKPPTAKQINEGEAVPISWSVLKEWLEKWLAEEADDYVPPIYSSECRISTHAKCDGMYYRSQGSWAVAVSNCTCWCHP